MSSWLWRNKWRIGGGLLVGGVALGLFAGCCSFSAPGYSGPTSDHFDGEQFQNQKNTEDHGFSDFLKWQFTSERGEWPEWVDAEPGPAPPERVGDGELRVTWINHATALIQMDGLNILTDPIYSKRASPVSWAGPQRHRPPGVRFEDLPPIDVVVISHNHYDHMDMPTLKRLAKTHSPRFIVPLGNSKLLRQNGIKETGDLDWWQRVPLSDKVRVTMVPAQHFSGRGLCDRKQTLWAGYVFEGPSGPVYFAGDTGWGPHFAQIRQKFGAPRLALLPIGAYRPVWFMHPVHISPAQAVRAREVLGAEHSVAIHFGTFRLADDGFDEPVEDLHKAIEATDQTEPDDFWVLEPGQGRDITD